MDKSAPSKWALERALKFNGHIECKCAVREGKSPCGFCRDMALEFDATRRENYNRGLSDGVAGTHADAADALKQCQRLLNERDEVTEKLAKALIGAKTVLVECWDLDCDHADCDIVRKINYALAAYYCERMER